MSTKSSPQTREPPCADFKYGFDEAKPKGDKTIEAYEYRSDCFTYDETEGNWTRHRPAKNRTYIVEATEPGLDGPNDPGKDTERYNRYYDQPVENSTSEPLLNS